MPYFINNTRPKHKIVKMKKLYTIIILLFISSISYSQNNHNLDKYKEKVKTMKISFLTNRLNLTSNEAQTFWPIYNAYDKNVSDLKMQYLQLINRMRREGKTIHDFNEEESSKLIEQELKREYDLVAEKQKLVEELNGVISKQKILILFKSEMDFNKQLLKRLKERRN